MKLLQAVVLALTRNSSAIGKCTLYVRSTDAQIYSSRYATITMHVMNTGVEVWLS
jgi:hypothetical protein